jgi:hypothetical protein
MNVATTQKRSDRMFRWGLLMPRLSRVRPAVWIMLVITGLVVISRVAFALGGVGPNIKSLIGQSDLVQLLDVNQLHHHLVVSIWYLQSQPPLFNLFTGLLLKLPPGWIRPTVIVVSVALELGMVVSCYFLCLELQVPRALTWVLIVLVVFDPATVLYGNWYFYSYPTASVMTFAALSIARYVRTRALVWGFCFFGAVTTIVLLNSTFQWFWLVVVAAPVVVALRHQWRRVLAVAMAPLLLLSVWYVKNEVLFHTDTTSSWFGMNLARITTEQAPPGQIRALIAAKKLSPQAATFPFLPLSAYGDTLTSHGSTGVAVLDQRTKSDGVPNFNDINYIAVSNQFFRDDIRYIEAEPGSYARNVAKAAELFFVPPEQYEFLEPDVSHMSWYLRTFDRFVKWQPQSANVETITFDAYSGDVPGPGQLSFAAMIAFAVIVFGVPFLAWRRRSDRPFGCALGFIWISTVYVFVLTTFVELGENERFRFDLGPLPLVAATAVVVALLSRVRRSNPPDPRLPSRPDGSSSAESPTSG